MSTALTLPSTAADITHLFSRVSGDPDGCWVFTGHKDRLGYGKLRLRGAAMLAHRAAFKVVNGFLPADKLVCHRCDNPSCINPEHLFLGSNYDNTMDAVGKGRKFIPPPRTGEDHPGAKLTAERVATIRREYAAGGISQKALAQRHGITQSTICNITKGKTWTNL